MDALREVVANLQREVDRLRDHRESIAYLAADYPELKKKVNDHDARIDSLEGTRDQTKGIYLGAMGLGGLCGALSAILAVMGLRG